MSVPAGRGTTIQSVERALDLMEALGNAPDGMPLGQLSAQTGLHFSTCHHLLATLVLRGYVNQDPRTKHYLLGNQVLRLQHARVQQINLVTLANPFLRELNQATGEAVHLAVLQARELVTVAKLESQHAIKVDNGFVGKSNAAHATATGKAILAYLADGELAAIIDSKGLPQFTRRTITSVSALKEELERVRQLGYSTDDEEFQLGVFCVGAPVWDHTSQVLASISCSAPQMRVANQEAIDRLIRLTRSIADRLSKELGFMGS